MGIQLEPKTQRISAKGVRSSTWKWIREYAIRNGISVAAVLDRAVAALKRGGK